MAEYSIGLALGGTNLRAAAVDHAGKILEKISVSANPMLGRESLLAGMVAVITDLRSRWGTDQLAGIGLGIPGFILLKEGVIRNSNNLAALEDFPFRDEMERRLKTKVVLENDANAADRKSTRLNSSHRCISYAVFCLKKKKKYKATSP